MSVKWISVKDCLPEYDHDVFVAFGDGIGSYVAQYLDGKWILSGQRHETHNEITYWMLIPDPPQAAQSRGET